MTELLPVSFFMSRCPKTTALLNEDPFLGVQANEYATATDDAKAAIMGIGNLLHRERHYEGAREITAYTDFLNKTPMFREFREFREFLANKGWFFSMPTPEQAAGSDRFVF